MLGGLGPVVASIPLPEIQECRKLPTSPLKRRASGFRRAVVVNAFTNVPGAFAPRGVPSPAASGWLSQRLAATPESGSRARSPEASSGGSLPLKIAEIT